ncbi:MAG: amidohydrolase family protein [Lacunisphaera sp.]
MRVIDAHVHLYPPDVGREPAAWAAATGENHWATLCTRRRKSGRLVQGFPTVGRLLHDMDAAGVEKAILLGWYWENQASCVWQNSFYAECISAHPDRLAAFVAVHPAAGDAALSEVRRAVDAGFIGVGELSPHSQQVKLDDPAWIKLVELAAELKLPVNLHVTDPASAAYPGRVETPLADFVRLAREFPQTKFILAHWGGGLAFDSENRPLRNVYYDTAASPLLYDADVWTKGMRAAAEERVIFGSDYPLIVYPQTETAPGFAGLLKEITSTGLTEPETIALLAGNAAQLLAI